MTKPLDLLPRSKVSPPDKMPSLRYPRLANITIHRSGAETIIDLYFWTSNHRSSFMHLHIGSGDDSWIRHGAQRPHDLNPLPSFAPYLFQYLYENPWTTPPRPFTDVMIGTFSMKADDSRISQKLREELSRVVRPVLAELMAEKEAVSQFVTPVEPAPITLMLLRSKESEANQ